MEQCQTCKCNVNNNDLIQKYQFSFKIYNPKIDGVIFLICGLIIPLFTLILLKYVWQMNTNNITENENWYLQISNIFIPLFSAVIGLIILYKRNGKILVHSGIIIFFLFQFIPWVMFWMSCAFTNLILGEYEIMTNLLTNQIARIIRNWFQIFGHFLIIIYSLFYITDLKQRIVSTFKYERKKLFYFIIFAIIVVMLIIIWNRINSGVNREPSENQKALTSLFFSSNKTIRLFYLFTYFCSTVIMAPLIEELVYRHAWFAGISNKIIGLLSSTLLFGLIHVSSGDFQNIWNYMFGGLILSTIFIWAKGNVIYCSIYHCIYNFVSIIPILSYFIF